MMIPSMLFFQFEGRSYNMDVAKLPRFKVAGWSSNFWKQRRSIRTSVHFQALYVLDIAWLPVPKYLDSYPAGGWRIAFDFDLSGNPQYDLCMKVGLESFCAMHDWPTFCRFQMFLALNKDLCIRQLKLYQMVNPLHWTTWMENMLQELEG